MTFMTTRACLLIALLLLGLAAKADDAAVSTSNSTPTLLNRWNVGVKETLRRVGAIKIDGQPRRVAKGAKPEIILHDEVIEYEGKQLRLGQSMREWRKVLPPGARCLHEPHELVCTWDHLGIRLLTAKENFDRVKQFEVFLGLTPKDPLDDLVTQLPDGTPIKKSPDMRPAKAFPGYLELDGFGIDAETKFGELRRSVDKKRDLTCGLRDCAFPAGSFSDGVVIYLELDGNTDGSSIRNFSLNLVKQ